MLRTEGLWFFVYTMFAMEQADLYELQDKWQIGIIDLYTDEVFNAIDKETYDLYMYDPIHPTKAGYAEWWMPKMESELIRILSESENRPAGK